MKQVMLVLLVFCAGCSLKQNDTKYLEVVALPDGLIITHNPEPCYAIQGGRSKRAYTWMHSTTVASFVGTVEILEFGAFSNINGRWIFSTFSGKPFTPTQFADWYYCPNATIRDGVSYTDPNNWTGGDIVRESQSLWYYIAQDKSGKKVKGIAIQTQRGILK